MKIAYLITAYGNYDHLARLVAALRGHGARFFIHIDAKSPMPGRETANSVVEGSPTSEGALWGADDVTVIARRRVWWGGWSHTGAIVDLMRMATAHGERFDYYSVMSGADYPLRPVAELHRILATGGEFINMREGFTPDKPEKRVKYYWFDGFDRRSRTPLALFMRAVEIAARCVARKRRYPFERAFVGTVWSVLSDACVRHIVDYIDSHPEYVRFFRTASIPEECFFHTIIGNSPFGARVRTSLTYTDWSGERSGGPARITLAHLDHLAPGHHTSLGRDYDRFFARKFDDGSSAVIEEIERRFRQVY